MLRKLFPILGLSLIAFPAAVLGLGLGEIRSTSSLNEPFRGEIALIGVKTTDLDAVKVRLASDKEFAKTGAQRFYFLSQLKFQPEASPSGHTVIAVTSTEPIREPFLDFLVEVNWPQGRFVREYTVLLDPPVTLPGVAPPPGAPATISPRTESPPAPARPAPGEQRSATAPRGARAPVTYGPVQRGETLWSIAKRVEVPGSTHQQVLQALFKENPAAFIDSDINRLRAGATLTLRNQDASVRDAQPGPGGTEQSTATTGSEEKYRLRIASPKSAEPAKGGVGAAPAGPRGDLEPDLSLVREESASIRQETGDLRQRVQELESQLTDVRKLLKLRNAQLAQLQVAVMGADASAGAEAAKAASVATQPVSEAEKEQTSPAALAGDQVVAVETPTAHRTSGVPDTALTSEAAPSREAGTDLAAKSTPPSTAQSAGETAPSPSASHPPRIEPDSGRSWMDTAAQLGAAMGEPTSLAVLGSTVVVLLLLLTYSVSRRHRAEASVPLGDPVSQAGGAPGLRQSVPEPGVMAAPRESAEKWANLFGKQPQPQVEQPPDEDKDVLAEADVYLGFARYKDAATLVRDALARQPARLDLKMKLAEIHHSAGDRAAFSRVFAEIKSSEQVQLDARSLERLSAMAADLGVDMDTGETKPAAQEPIPEPSPLMAEKAAPMQAQPGWGARQEKVAEPLDLESNLDLDAALREIEQISSRPIVEVKDAPPRSAEEREVMEWLDKLGPELGPTDYNKLTAASQEQSGPGEAEGTKGPGARESEPTDETAIKLDLARAYLAMSDNDGARFILEEVMEEAEGAQKAEAERLLASLG